MDLNTFAASGGCGLLKRNDSLCQGESVAFANKGGPGYHRTKCPTRITLKCTGYITIQSPEPDHPLTVHEVKETYYLCTPKEPKIPAPHTQSYTTSDARPIQNHHPLRQHPLQRPVHRSAETPNPRRKHRHQRRPLRPLRRQRSMD